MLKALERVLVQRKWSAGLIVHSDRGRQYVGVVFRKLLADKQISQSMSARGNCHDNATMETFLGAFKRENLDRVEFVDALIARHDQAGDNNPRPGRVIPRKVAPQQILPPFLSTLPIKSILMDIARRKK